MQHVCTVIVCMHVCMQGMCTEVATLGSLPLLSKYDMWEKQQCEIAPGESGQGARVGVQVKSCTSPNSVNV